MGNPIKCSQAAHCRTLAKVVCVYQSSQLLESGDGLYPIGNGFHFKTEESKKSKGSPPNLQFKNRHNFFLNRRTFDVHKAESQVDLTRHGQTFQKKNFSLGIVFFFYLYARENKAHKMALWTPQISPFLTLTQNCSAIYWQRFYHY